MAVTATWKTGWRISREASFGAANPESKLDWNIGGNGGGVNGWIDLPAIDGDGLTGKRPTIFPTGLTGLRAMNVATPVKGADMMELGSLEFPVYPENIDRIIIGLLGSVARVETAGAAAQASTAFASLASLTTQPNGTEVLKFVIASSTAASAAAINIIQGGVTVETITIGTSASTVDGDYYSKGAYDGSASAITFSVDGTVTSGLVTVSGVDFATNTHTITTNNNPNYLVVEQQERIEAGSGNSQYFSGVITPESTFAYDRNAADGLLTCNTTFHGKLPTEATKTTYSEDVGKYYQPIAAWNGAVKLDDVSYAEVVSANWTIRSNNGLYVVSSGNQTPTAGLTGQIEVTGQMTIIPADGSRHDDYLAGTVRDLEFDFLTGNYVVDTTPFRALFTFTEVYIEDYAQTRVTFGGTAAMGATVNWRGVYNTTDSGPLQIVTRSRLPV